MISNSLNSQELSFHIANFSKREDFYLRLLRVLLSIRLIISLVLCIGFNAPLPLLIYAFIIGIFLGISFIAKTRFKYNQKILYTLIIIDIILMLYLQHIQYKNIFFLSICVISVAIFSNIWSMLSVAIISAVISLGMNILKIENIFSLAALMLFSSILNTLSKQQRNMYQTVAVQAYQSAFQQITHILMLKDITDGILLLSHYGEIISANNAALKILGLEDVKQSNSSIEYLYNSSLDRVPKTILLDDKKAHAHLMPIDNHVQNIYLQIGWIDWLKPYVNTLSIENHLNDMLYNSTIIHIEREQKYLKEAQKDKLASMGHMVAGVAHEIRNPLATIQQASDLLYEQLENDDSNIRLQNMINNNIQRINTIITNLLNISRPPTNSINICLTTSLKQIIQDWIARDKTRLNVITTYIPENDLYINFTLIHLQQIIENLLDNAWRFCSQTVAAINIWVRHNPQYNSLLEIWILNDGPIIEASDQTRLFEPFFTKSLPTHSTKGIGLGLHIVRILCMQNKATIEYTKNIDIPFKASYGFVIKIKKENSLVG